MRVEDLDDRAHTDIANRQLDDLAAIGLTRDEPADWQSEHPQRYDAVVGELADRGLLYECYCSRRDIAQAHLDEVFVQINGAQRYLWRAVDQHRKVLDILVGSRPFVARPPTTTP